MTHRPRPTHPSRRRAVALGAAVTAGLLLTACSNDADINPTDEPTEPADGGGSGAETYDLTIAVLPIADLGAYFYAQDNGIFEEHGLDITTESATGGSAAIAAMSAGDYDIVYSGADGAIKAFVNGLPIQVISGANNNQPEGDVGSTPLVLAPGIDDVSDVAGTSIATNALGNINQVYAQAYLAEQGVTDVDVVEIPFPEQVAALTSGEISASLIPEPFASQAVEAGGTIAGYPYRIGTDETTLVGVYASTDTFIDDNPEAVQAFIDAMTEASTAANDPANRDALVESILNNTQLESDVANNMTFVQFSTDATVEKLQFTADLLTEYEVLPDEVDVSGILSQ